MMNSFIIYFLIFVFGVLIGFIIGKLLSKLYFEKDKSSLEKEKSILEERVVQHLATISLRDNKLINLEKEVKAIQLEKENLLQNNSKLLATIENLNQRLEEHKKEVENLQEKFKNEFEVLANKIFEDKSAKFTNQNKENINTILNPLKEKIESFEKKVSETQEKNHGMHAALKTQLENLKDLNQQMTKEAVNLTRALKGDSKKQGDWGETQLELLLEKANLIKDIHFTTQGGYRDEEGKLKKPDFIINLPENRQLIIDSKVSLVAYENYFSEEDESQKELYLKQHIDSIRTHFKSLGSKNYESLYEINSPDYVLMFVPIEPALLIALNKANNLYIEALDKNVVLVSTSTLLATLSTVSSIWRHENQKRNVIEIANQAGALYDQFVNLTEDLIKLGNQLKTVQNSYDSSMKKLTGQGNLTKKVEKIKKLGAKTTKSLHPKLLDKANLED